MLLSIFAVLLVGLALFYAGMLGAFAWGFHRVFSVEEDSDGPAPADGERPFVSVVIAARNEAACIADCLDAVLQSRYPAERFEVIVVDDFSTDATVARVRRFIREHERVLQGSGGAPPGAAVSPEAPAAHPRLRFLRMDRVADTSAGHKREALNHGISAARGPLVLTTDADCTPAPGWIGAMAGRFDADVAFVAGPVRYQLEGSGPLPKRLFEQVQALEFLALQAAGAGGIGLGRPTICNSANVAYRQRVYEALYRSETLGAADDETLIQRIAEETDQRVAFCPAPEARVETPPADGPRAFLRQRQRWASMTPRYPDLGFTLALGGVYGFYLLLLAAAVAVWWLPALALPLAGAFVLKLAAEAALLAPTCRRFGQPRLRWLMLPAQPLHALYMVGIVAAGVLGETRWKGRTVD